MKKREPGFTLVELLITLAITGLIISVIGSAIYQLITVAEYGNDRLTATHELENTAHWFSLDGQQASAASGGSGLVLTLPNRPSVTYSLVGTELRRTAGSAPMTLARNITGASFSVAGRLVTMTLTSAPPGRWAVSEPGTYMVCLRAEEQE